MKTYLATMFAGVAFMAFTGMAVAHHSWPQLGAGLQ